MGEIGPSHEDRFRYEKFLCRFERRASPLGQHGSLRAAGSKKRRVGPSPDFERAETAQGVLARPQNQRNPCGIPDTGRFVPVSMLGTGESGASCDVMSARRENRVVNQCGDRARCMLRLCNRSGRGRSPSAIRWPRSFILARPLAAEPISLRVISRFSVLGLSISTLSV